MPAGVFFLRSSVLVINTVMIAGGSQVSPRGTGNHSEHVSTEGSYSLRQRARYEPHAQQDNDPCTEARSATTVFPDMRLPQPPIRVAPLLVPGARRRLQEPGRRLSKGANEFA